MYRYQFPHNIHKEVKAMKMKYHNIFWVDQKTGYTYDYYIQKFLSFVIQFPFEGSALPRESFFANERYLPYIKALPLLRFFLLLLGDRDDPINNMPFLTN